MADSSHTTRDYLSPYGEDIEMACLLEDSDAGEGSSSALARASAFGQRGDAGKRPEPPCDEEQLLTSGRQTQLPLESWWSQWRARRSSKFDRDWAIQYRFDKQVFTKVQRIRLSLNDPAVVRGISHAIEILEPSAELQTHIGVLKHALQETLRRDEVRKEHTYDLFFRWKTAVTAGVVGWSGLAVLLALSIAGVGNSASIYDKARSRMTPSPASEAAFALWTQDHTPDARHTPQSCSKRCIGDDRSSCTSEGALTVSVTTKDDQTLTNDRKDPSDPDLSVATGALGTENPHHLQEIALSMTNLLREPEMRPLLSQYGLTTQEAQELWHLLTCEHDEIASSAPEISGVEAR